MIYVCVPAHNEERTIGVLLWKVRNVMREFGRDFEILVLDDASDDRTGEVLEPYVDELPLQVIHSEEQVGYGAALDRLLREVVERSPYPKRDVAVTLQGDFTEDPADLVPMVKKIEGGADLVAGSMIPPDDGLPTTLRLARRLAPRLLGAAFRGAPVSDPLSGFRAYRVIVLKKAFRDLENGAAPAVGPEWAANLSLLATVAPHARRIEEAPFRMELSRRERDSRFRAFANLRGLAGLRGTTWPQTPSGRGSA